MVRDAGSDAYVLRTYERDDPDGAALLAHLGRALVTEVTLRVGANTNLRCVSRTDIPAAEPFAAPGDPTGERTLASGRGRLGRRGGTGHRSDLGVGKPLGIGDAEREQRDGDREHRVADHSRALPPQKNLRSSCARLRATGRRAIITARP